MKAGNKHIWSVQGFTLVEMLATIAIIAILVSLLIPAVGYIRRTADNLKQKSQFQSIEMGLEGFRSDSSYGDYPESYFDISIVDEGYCGAQKLAEALVGLDGFGFHPQSIFKSDGTDGNGVPLYKPAVDGYIDSLPLTAAEKDAAKKANLAIRKGLYLELETANVVKLWDLYGIGNTDILAGDTFVLADMFGKVKHIGTQKRTGMPILYFKADTSKFLHDMGQRDDSTYDVHDSLELAFLSPPWDSSMSHPLFYPGSGEIFYDQTANPNFTLPVRPYRAESFILMSAGADGLYGTSDDVFNFDSE